MSTEKKGGGDDTFGQDIDFGGFGGEGKAGPDFEPDIDLSIDEAPIQGKSSRPANKPAAMTEDAFAGFGGGSDKPSFEDVGGIAGTRPLKDSDFGGDEEAEIPAISGAPARQEHERVSFGGDEDEDEGRDEDHRSAGLNSDDEGVDNGDHDDDDHEGAGDEDESDEGEEGAVDKKARLIQLATYAGIGVGGLALLYFSWVQVIQPYIGPLIGLDKPAVVQVGAPQPVGQQFGQRPAPQQGQLPPLQSTQPGGGAPSLPPPSLPAPGTLPAPVPQLPPVAAKPDAATIERINRLEEQLRAVTNARSDLEQRAKGLEERVGALEARGVSQMPKPTTEVPLKPEVLSGWALRGVSRGVAWVQSPSGSTLQVKAGDVLPDNGGVVKQVSKYEKDFIVITDRGVIVQR